MFSDGIDSVVTKTGPAIGRMPWTYSDEAAPKSVVSTSVPLTQSPTIEKQLANTNKIAAADVNASARPNLAGKLR